ncbi:MAG: Aminobenzoyl-glutamate transport protein [Ignavibacteriae bacterium]|nr:MAG: Aminobenzoyl-glutamate transport protein [Ignavibacteriota bacterium]
MKNTISYIKNLFSKSLLIIEKIGNSLPHPATLFAILAVLVMIISAISSYWEVQAIHPSDGSVIKVTNLLSGDGLRWIYTNIFKNFVEFPPLGIVLTAMIGIGIAEGTGLLSVLIKALVLVAPKKLITATIIFTGVMSHTASEAGYVILIPLSALVFLTLGRHPLAGLAAAFAGVSGGFGANFLIGSIDPVLAGLSQSAAQIINPDIHLNPAINFYFMFASGILIVILGTWVTEKIVEPRLGKYDGDVTAPKLEQITPTEKKGLIWAGISSLITIIVLLLLVLPDGALLRNPSTNSIIKSPFLDGMITAVMIFFFVPGIAYGIAVKNIKNDHDAVKHIIKFFSSMAGYIVLVFFAAQFVYFFRHSNLGIILAIEGADFLKSLGLTGIALIVGFVILSAFINMFMGSASAKWAIMAPVFVPMFMLLGYHPALTQVAFRIGDSVTNVITPMMSYFALIVTFAEKYKSTYGIGTIISTMLPYTVFFLIGWLILLIIWMITGIPLGPEGYLFYNDK